MSNERADEFSGWAGRLEEPGALIEQGLSDKEASWDRLHARMGGKLRRRRLAWYWSAAACLLLALPAAYILRNLSAHTDRTASGPVKQQDPQASNPGLAVKPKHEPGTETILSQAPRMPLTPAPGTLRDNPGMDRTASHTLTVTVAGPSDHRSNQNKEAGPAAKTAKTTRTSPAPDLADLTPDASPDSAAHLQLAVNADAPQTPITVKKELKVISINEIAVPQRMEYPASGHPRRTGQFRIGLGSAGSYRPAMASQSTDRSGFTIKLSSQNP